jgi:pimeloyl-ACP methyl ester carboxylesterase
MLECTLSSRLRYLIALAAAASMANGPILASPRTPQLGGHAAFTVVYRGERVGRTDITVEHSGAGWKITSSGRLSAPVDLLISSFDVRYTDEWQPQMMAFEVTLQGQLASSTVTFDATTARGETVQGGKVTPLSHVVSARTVVLPSLFFAGYEALATRLTTAQPGAAFPVYLGQTSETTATFVRATNKRLQTTAGMVDVRACELTFGYAAGPLAVELWVDGNGRMARLAIPAQTLEVVRDDLASVMTREERHHNAGDQNVFIPAAGFTLAATVTTPATTPGKQAPAVVLIGSADAVDRDEAMANVPIFGQLAGELAAAGYLVVRYDRRGAGQSGGRVESAALEDYALDAGSVVTWLRQRPDVDRAHVAVIGHAEGGLAALIAAQRFKSDIAAVGLAGTAGMPGRALTVLQQAHTLQQTAEPDASRQDKISLQTRLMDAVITGKGWENLPAAMRRQSDTLWYRSWLTFDPVAAIGRVRQPILILQGSIDMSVFAASAELLQKAARARANTTASATRTAIVPNVNHLLIEARTGEVDEYPSLAGGTIAPSVVSIIREWLDAVLRPSKNRLD